MSYKKLQGKCVYCLGCTRLEDINFNGTNNCIWAEKNIEYTQKISATKIYFVK